MINTGLKIKRVLSIKVRLMKSTPYDISLHHTRVFLVNSLEIDIGMRDAIYNADSGFPFSLWHADSLIIQEPNPFLLFPKEVIETCKRRPKPKYDPYQITSPAHSALLPIE